MDYPLNHDENDFPLPEAETQPLNSPDESYVGAEPNTAHPEEPVSPPPRKESPYASSPYVMNSQARDYTYQPQPAVKAPKAQEKKQKSAGGGVWKTLLAGVLIIALVVVGCGITATSVNRRWESWAAESTQTVEALSAKVSELQRRLNSSGSSGAVTQQLPASGSGLALSQLYAQSVNSVVAITSTVTQMSLYGASEGQSSGSGFILTADGYIVTNYHVIEDAKQITVTTHDGTEYTANVQGYDAANDVAVLKVEAQELPAASIGASSDLLIGDMVVAIGNPLGELTATQTVGYVSGINREVSTDNTIMSMIQTDAAINPGNSGGPLFNMYGQVIGITTAKYSGTTGSGASIEGIGFAIPIDDVVPIIDDLIAYGHVTGAYLGVTVQNADAESAAMFGLPTGAYVLEVVEGGSADRAGVQPKDLIIDLGGTKVTSVTELTRTLRSFRAGDTTTITVLRGGKELTLDITLDEKPYQEATSYPQPDSEMPSEGSYDEWFNWFFGRENNG